MDKNPALVGALMGSVHLILCIAYAIVLYFAIRLTKARLTGAPYIAIGMTVVLVGEVTSTMTLTVPYLPPTWLLVQFLRPLGFCLSAIGFARLARALIARGNG
jgi:hypothetical protein